MATTTTDADVERARERLRRSTRRLRFFGRIYTDDQRWLLGRCAATAYADLADAGLKASADLIVAAAARL